VNRKVVLLSDVRGIGEDPIRYLPLSLMAIATVLNHRGFDAVVLDAQVEPRWRDLLRTHLRDALLFGVSALTGPSLFAVLEGIGIAREQAPHVPVVWGGYHATQAYRSILDEGLADYVIRGPGEDAIVELAAALQESGSAAGANRLRAIANLVYRDAVDLRVNPRRLMGAMGRLPPLDYGLVEVARYLRGEHRYLQYVSSYGCPYACTFCAEPAQSQRAWRGLDAGRFVDEVLALWKAYRPEKIYLVDPNFSSNPNRVIAIVREMRARQAYVEMFCDMRAGDVLRIAEHVKLEELREVGFGEVFIGLESGSDRMLALLRKQLTAADGLRACRMVAAAGIRSCTSFIHDLPGETLEDTERTLELSAALCHLDGNTQSHHFYTPYPATEMYDQLRRDGGLQERRTQLDWARTSTFYGSEVWPGRMSFRRTVLRRLLELHKRYPGRLPKSNLPVLRPLRMPGALVAAEG
jgi:radical SAM superfamily enzyme YgiQ (UPF0313 family)